MRKWDHQIRMVCTQKAEFTYKELTPVEIGLSTTFCILFQFSIYGTLTSNK